MKTMTINGKSITFKRRRYGRQWYCWVYADNVSLGDPWPTMTPSVAEIEKAITTTMKG